MEFEALHDRFLELELEEDLFDVSAAGVPVWERIRFDVFQYVYDRASLDYRSEGKEKTLGSALSALSLLLRNVVERNPLLADDSQYLFFGHPRRELRDDGRYWDLYVDPILAELDLDYTYLEYDFDFEHRQPTRTENVRYVDFIEYGGTIAKELRGARFPSDASDRLRSASERFHDEFGVNVDLTGLASKDLRERQVTVPLYERVLSRVAPDVAVIVVGYTRENFIEACRNRSVPVVELQHGAVNDYHVGYSFPGPRTKVFFPDYFFTFGEYWNDSAAYPIPDEHVIAVGYPYFEHEVARLTPRSEGRSILFVSQVGIDDGFSKMAVDLAESLPEYEVVYKLHPDEESGWRERYPWLVDSPVRVAAEGALYEYFASANVQVGVGSTAIYEGLGFGLETYLVDFSGVETLFDIVERGDATFVESVEELARCIQEDRGDRAPARAYFADHAVENFRAAIDEVIRSGGERRGDTGSTV